MMLEGLLLDNVRYLHCRWRWGWEQISKLVHHSCLTCIRAAHLSDTAGIGLCLVRLTC